MKKLARLAAAATFLFAGSALAADTLDADITLSQADSTFSLQSAHKGCTKDKYLVTFTISQTAPLTGAITADEAASLVQHYKDAVEAPANALFRIIAELQTSGQIRQGIAAQDPYVALNGVTLNDPKTDLIGKTDALASGFGKFGDENGEAIGRHADIEHGYLNLTMKISPAPSPLCR